MKWIYKNLPQAMCLEIVFAIHCRSERSVAALKENFQVIQYQISYPPAIANTTGGNQSLMIVLRVKIHSYRHQLFKPS